MVEIEAIRKVVIQKMGEYGIPKKRNRKLTGYSIDFILAYSERWRRKREDWELGLRNEVEGDEQYIISTALGFAYNILINEGFAKKHLDQFFFEGKPGKYRERTEKAYSFYFRGLSLTERIQDFFYRDPKGIKLRREIDNLKKK